MKVRKLLLKNGEDPNKIPKKQVLRHDMNGNIKYLPSGSANLNILKKIEQQAKENMV